MTTAILLLFSQETYILMKVIMKCVNIKLWDLLGCFHYILNVPRMFRLNKMKENIGTKVLIIYLFVLNDDKMLKSMSLFCC